ncbi:MAG TPA: hypothetical protein VFI91_08390 [Longimicrobiaceae bacterium]|nr:hypothetical protein [Longimicrobiaceae bacterium]
MTSRLVGIFPILIVLACAGETGPGGGVASDAAADISAESLPGREEFVQNGLISPGTDRASFTEALGQPDSASAEIIPNRHIPDAQDSIITIYYPRVIATVHRPGPGGELLKSVQVSDNQFLRYPVIGAASEVIATAFGEPDEQTINTVTYFCTSCTAGNNPVRFSFEDGRVRSVRFSYYVD